MSPLHEGGFPDEAFETAWARSIFVLRFNAEQMPSSERAIAFIEALRAKVCGPVLPQGRNEFQNHDSETSPIANEEVVQTPFSNLDEIIGESSVWDLGIFGVNDFTWPTNWN